MRNAITAVIATPMITKTFSWLFLVESIDELKILASTLHCLPSEGDVLGIRNDGVALVCLSEGVGKGVSEGVDEGLVVTATCSGREVVVMLSGCPNELLPTSVGTVSSMGELEPDKKGRENISTLNKC